MSKKTGVFWHFLPILTIFRSLCLSGSILSHQTSNGMFSGSWRIFWHPWDLWGQIHIDLNKNSVWTGCVIKGTTTLKKQFFFAKGGSFFKKCNCKLNWQVILPGWLYFVLKYIFMKVQSLICARESFVEFYFIWSYLLKETFLGIQST